MADSIPVAYERIGKVLGEAREKRKHFGQTPVFDIGLYFSSRTRDWIAREEPATYFHSFQGAHQACVMEHLQFGVVLDENVSLDGLKKFPVVCLPNVAILSGREVNLLATTSEQGGNLLITGQTGQFDAMGEPLQNSAHHGPDRSRRRRGVSKRKTIGSASMPHRNFLSPLKRAVEPTAPRLEVLGQRSGHGLQTDDSQELLGHSMRPIAPTARQQGKMHTEWPMSAGESVGPAVLLNRVGKGLVVTCAASPDYASASEHALVEDRILFRNLFRVLHPESRSPLTRRPMSRQSSLTIPVRENCEFTFSRTTPRHARRRRRIAPTSCPA